MQTLVIDGHRFAIDFAGFSRPLRARVIDPEHEGGAEAGAGSDSSSTDVELQPWRCADHLAQLRAALRLGPAGVGLDAAVYADAVLGPAREGDQRLRSLALWWASGREPDGRREPEPRPDAEGWVGLDGRGTAAQLRPWTWGQRLAAGRANLHELAPASDDRDTDGRNTDGLDFDAVAYLEAMLDACVIELRQADGQRDRSARAWAQLDAQASRRLIAAVVALNHPERDDDPLAAISPALAASTLRLCAALGWTPERVLATPAAEVQRLSMLLDKVDGQRQAARARARPRAAARARQPRRPSVADHPDAVVILFSDDDDGDGDGGSA